MPTIRRLLRNKRVLLAGVLLLLVLTTPLVLYTAAQAQQPKMSAAPVATAVARASHETGVPASLLTAICYMEGRLSNHGGSPSIDGGYGCMHLVHNSHGDTLDQAAQDLHVSADTLKTDIAANIRGGAAVLRDDALRGSPTHTLPEALGDWYGAVAAYSSATTHATALLYADAVYQVLRNGFSAMTDDGETVTLARDAVTANTRTASGAVSAAATLPAGCVNDGKVDYPSAIDCILNPSTYDCNKVATNAPCTYEDATRPATLPVQFVVIHDIEGTAQDALNVFQDVHSGVSIHYIVDSDGTVYQVVHDTDIAYHAGNFWYNQRAVGIEHAGYDATGYQWYNATEYLASAKLTAYLLRKYSIPLDHAHVIAHGTTPAPGLAYTPNHVDPGPYWLWDYYFGLIQRQGVSGPQLLGVRPGSRPPTITVRPPSGLTPAGANGTETASNFNFFTLYSGPSTTSGVIAHPGSGTDSTDETANVEPEMSYYYVSSQGDAAGTGDTMYEIWYGAENTAQSYSAHGVLAWLAVPAGAAVIGSDPTVAIAGASGSKVSIYGRIPDPSNPASTYVIGDAPSGAVFVTALTETDAATGTVWDEINYNHRQAWVPASAVVRQ